MATDSWEAHLNLGAFIWKFGLQIWIRFDSNQFKSYEDSFKLMTMIEPQLNHWFRSKPLTREENHNYKRFSRRRKGRTFWRIGELEENGRAFGDCKRDSTSTHFQRCYNLDLDFWGMHHSRSPISSSFSSYKSMKTIIKSCKIFLFALNLYC